jgi:hypothetical protein
MIKFQNRRGRAIDELIENVKVQDFLPNEGSPAFMFFNGKKIYMPAYIPYIGREYFKHRPRILCYAINQNLSKHRIWSETWMQEWAADQTYAIDRLNRTVDQGKAMPIKPYAEGFIPLVALLYLSASDTRKFDNLPVTIDKVLSVSNFVKFSTSNYASSSEIPGSWWLECGSRYIRNEIDILKPDVIITFGKKTHVQLEKVLLDMNYPDKSLQIHNCRFPGRIPSKKARPLRGEEKVRWEKDILPLTSRIEFHSESFVTWRMTRFPRYFLDIANALS